MYSYEAALKSSLPPYSISGSVVFLSEKMGCSGIHPPSEGVVYFCSDLRPGDLKRKMSDNPYFESVKKR